MRVVGWVLVWLALIGGSAWWLYQRVRWLWGRAAALSDQVAEAEQQAAEVAARARAAAEQRLRDAPPPAEPAIFRHPLDVAIERADLRERHRLERQLSRAARRPGWARHVD